MESLTDLYAERAQYQAQLDEIKKLPGLDAELQDIAAELAKEIANFDEKIAAKTSNGNGNSAASNNASAVAKDAATPSIDASSTHAPQATTSIRNDAAPKSASGETVSQTFNVNDKVSARWSTDRQFYPARIVSVTGSKADRLYTVMFDGYKDTETLRSHQLRAPTGKKRKAETSEPPSPPKTAPPTTKSGSVISAAANVNPALVAEARKEAGKASDGAPRPAKFAKKLKNSERLEQNQGNWQAFSSKSLKGLKGMRGTKSNGIFRSQNERTQPGAPDPKVPARKGLSKTRPKFDNPDVSDA